MKIVHVITSTYGGAAKAALRLNNSLRKLGYDSQALTLFSHYKLPDVYRYLQDFNIPIIQKVCNSVKARHYNYKLNKLRNKIHSSTEVVTIPDSPYDLLNNNLIAKSDIIHLHWTSGFLDYKSFFKRVDKPVIFTLHDLNPFRGLFHYEMDELLNCNLKDLDLAIQASKRLLISSKNSNIWALTLSEWIGGLARKSGFYLSEKILNIQNGIDLELFKPGDKSEARKRFGLSEKRLCILFSAGNLDAKRKGFEFFKKLAKEKLGEDFEFIAIGESSTHEESGIKFLGFIKSEEELVDIYNASDLYITTTLEDNQPNTIIESMACGVPVLAFSSGGVPEFIDSDVDGKLVEGTNYKRLVTCFDELVINMQILKDMGKRARQKAEKYFDIQDSTIKHIQVYKRILGYQKDSSTNK